jgi:hypothetical protein
MLFSSNEIAVALKLMQELENETRITTH